MSFDNHPLCWSAHDPPCPSVVIDAFDPTRRCPAWITCSSMMIDDVRNVRFISLCVICEQGSFDPDARILEFKNIPIVSNADPANEYWESLKAFRQDNRYLTASRSDAAQQLVKECTRRRTGPPDLIERSPPSPSRILWTKVITIEDPLDQGSGHRFPPNVCIPLNYADFFYPRKWYIVNLRTCYI